MGRQFSLSIHLSCKLTRYEVNPIQNKFIFNISTSSAYCDTFILDNRIIVLYDYEVCSIHRIQKVM